MKKNILIINGPNLNLLGNREPQMYGNMSFDEYFGSLKKKFVNLSIDYFQSNTEGFIIDKIQESRYLYDGIILNAGAYTHSSIAISDCIRSIEKDVIEVHISNVYNRESYRCNSLLSAHCKGIVVGFGLFSYDLALEYFNQI